MRTNGHFGHLLDRVCRWLTLLLLWGLLIPIVRAEDPPSQETVRNIGDRLELFVDDWLIETMTGVSLELHHPHPAEVVYQFDAPWEANGAAYITIFEDGGKYRMYYRADGGQGIEGGICYAESPDGIHWTRPQLDRLAGSGGVPNNIMLRGQEGTHNFTPFRDANPATPAEARYRATGNVDRMMDSKKVSGLELVAFQSKDGIHWEARQTIGRRDEPPRTGEFRGMFDSQNVAFWDAYRGQYRAYWRVSENGIRAIRTATSTDFVTWETVGNLTYPTGTPNEHLYTNAIQPYPRAPHLLIGLPQRFIPESWMTYAVDPDRNKLPLADGVFMSSRDGQHWQRWAEAFIRPGIARQQWSEIATHANNMPAWGIVTTKASEAGWPDELSLYVTEFPQAGPDTPGGPGCLRRYTLRMDGFVSVHAGGASGEFVTRPLVFAGRKVTLNYSTSAAGGIRVEVQDAAGKPLDGFSWKDCPELRGDAIEQAVSWASDRDLGVLAGKPVRLRFLMKDADVYALRIRP